MYLTSPQNDRIKQLITLEQKSSQRRREGLFVVEGRREIERCIAAGFTVETIFHQPELAPALPTLPPGTEVITVSDRVYQRIALRGSTEGIVATVKARHLTLADLRLGPSPLIVVLESVEKPGNLGAVLRSADAAAADAVIVCDPLTDIYNPNIIRSSTGTIFTLPCVACTSEECIRFLAENNIQILTAQLQDSQLYYDTDMRGPTAIVFGTESTGLTPQWRHAASSHIRIPMLGTADSLNVSVSAAILLFEAVRQRHTTA